jgi:cytochrome c553
VRSILRAAVLAGMTAHATAAPVPPPKIEAAQGSYLLYCGGCHGINGHSSDIAVPGLKGQVDAFLCLPAGREYIVRLPNVAFAPLSDAQLAELMNFVVALGRTREGRGDRPYTAAEVGVLRRKPLIGEAIAGYRSELVRRLIEKCGAPRSLLSYGGGDRNLRDSRPRSYRPSSPATALELP